MEACEEIQQGVINSCRVVLSAADTQGAEGQDTYGVQLFYSDGACLFVPDVSPCFEEAEALASRLCGQDVGPDMVPVVVYEFLCTVYG